MAKLTINVASVKVMRSFDYCHFEINLGATLDCPPDSPEWFSKVDGIRKNAARLADKAVEQYKIAKQHFSDREFTMQHLSYAAERAKKTPDSERTPEETAAIKAYSDALFEQRHYDYQDDWED